MSELLTPRLPFTYEEFEAAAAPPPRGWNANCGPGALAFAAFACRYLEPLAVKPLDQVRFAMIRCGFESKGYTSPTMMKNAIEALGMRFVSAVPRPDMRDVMFSQSLALVRIQFTGPWTAPGSNPKWAYMHTHWVATWLVPPLAISGHSAKMIFDVNCGIIDMLRWEAHILPVLTKGISRADGGWHPTHIWRLPA